MEQRLDCLRLYRLQSVRTNRLFYFSLSEISWEKPLGGYPIPFGQHGAGVYLQYFFGESVFYFCFDFIAFPAVFRHFPVLFQCFI